MAQDAGQVDAEEEREAAALRRVRLALETTLGTPFTEGNAIQPLRNGEEIFPPMLEAIGRAERLVEFLTFVYWTGDVAWRFADALAERARAGVPVRVLLDGYGTAPMAREVLDRMTEAGVEVQTFRPLPTWRVWRTDNRTHRKVMVVDGREAFTGGVGIAEEWDGAARDPSEWRDTHFHVRGPAVLGLRATFLDNWIETTHSAAGTLDSLWPVEPAGDLAVQVMRSTAGFGWSDVATLHEVLIRKAERRLRFVTPYFSPSPETADRLIQATRRGVEVEIMIPGPHVDKRVSELASGEEIRRLLEDGVRIHAFQPTMLHAKSVTVDGVFASVGSANLNHRSSVKDDEVMLNVADRDFAAEIDRHFDEDLRLCEPVGPKEWRRRSGLRRAKETVARVVKPET